MLRKYFSLLFLVFILSACSTSRTTVSKNIDLSKYQYASIINNDTYHIPAELMEYEILLFDAVEASRLQLISDRRIYELTNEQKEKLLLAKYGVSQNETETVVTVNFIDYMTGRPVVSCSGSSVLGLDYSMELKKAIKAVSKQIESTFPQQKP